MIDRLLTRTHAILAGAVMRLDLLGARRLANPVNVLRQHVLEIRDMRRGRNGG